jgi:hypothetical protein
MGSLDAASLGHAPLRGVSRIAEAASVGGPHSLSIRFEAFRQSRRFVGICTVAVRAGCAGRTTGAGVRAFPRLIRVSLAYPAGVFAEQAHLRERLSTRRSTGLVQKIGDCGEDYESWPEKTGLHALSGSAGDAPLVRHVLVDGKPDPQQPQARGSGFFHLGTWSAGLHPSLGQRRRLHSWLVIALQSLTCALVGVVEVLNQRGQCGGADDI